MFGQLIRSFTGGANGAKAIQVLRNTYRLEVNHPQLIEMMKRIASSFGEVYNEHEMAVQFLVQFCDTTLQPDHPQASREMEKYIRMAKGSYNRGLVESNVVMNELFRVAKERFQIDPDQIQAA